jgi:hypothetical protein
MASAGDPAPGRATDPGLWRSFAFKARPREHLSDLRYTFASVVAQIGFSVTRAR